MILTTLRFWLDLGFRSQKFVRVRISSDDQAIGKNIDMTLNRKHGIISSSGGIHIHIQPRASLFPLLTLHSPQPLFSCLSSLVNLLTNSLFFALRAKTHAHTKSPPPLQPAPQSQPHPIIRTLIPLIQLRRHRLPRNPGRNSHAGRQRREGRRQRGRVGRSPGYCPWLVDLDAVREEAG